MWVIHESLRYTRRCLRVCRSASHRKGSNPFGLVESLWLTGKSMAFSTHYSLRSNMDAPVDNVDNVLYALPGEDTERN